MRYLVRERIFGIGDDYWIDDEYGEHAFLVDGKALRVRQTFQLKDAQGEVVAVIRRKMISLWETMEIERGGERLATVRKKRFTLLRNRFKARLADGGALSVHGNVLDKEYDIELGGGRLARISRKWFRVRDTYAVDIEQPGADVPLLLSLAVCVDALTGER
ncbi:LURP-one-related/scramblase family protein [Streptomyces winkii]|uniref:LURP-one-related/scramblase family protein n=1 Tax=Streptomyces winkii TaxID=3051178 RepID=UPI0028D7C78A|nr:LURP-one-related family protein [Streptomyces sp. DSM 40971]